MSWHALIGAIGRRGVAQPRVARRAVSLALAAGPAAWLLAACGLKLPFAAKPPPPAPVPTALPAQAPPVFGRIDAADDLNPSASGRPSPLLLRIYELKAIDSFSRAEFMALYQADEAALGADVLAREEFLLQPGESRRRSKVLEQGTRFVAVFGAFRDTEQVIWRVSAAVPPGRAAQALTIRADARGLALSLTVA